MIGAGVGGCYTAFRLVTGSQNVTLYESGYRAGGRIWSVPVRGGGWAELGAMRLNRESAPVMKLLGHLGLTEALTPFHFGRSENFVRARGSLLRQRDYANASAIPYAVRKRSHVTDADGLSFEAVEAAVPGFGRLREIYHRAVRDQRPAGAVSAQARYRAACRKAMVQGEPLEKASWPQVLAAALDREALRLVADTGGYDVHTGGAAAWIDVLFHTPPLAEYVTLSCGMQSLPRALHSAFEGAGGRTRWGHRLCRIALTERAEGPYELTFALEDRMGRDTGHRKRIQADTVVLALPQGPLRRIEAGPEVFSRFWREDLEAVEPVRAVKLFLAYDEPWWRACGVETGRSTTDLPLRQLWYAPGGASRLLLAAYPSGPSTAFWDRFDTGPSYQVPGGMGAFRAGPAAPAGAVDYAHELLCRMHRVRAHPPVAACWQDWGRPPYSAAWHMWRAGQAREEVAARMRAPAPGGSLHVVSDCWTVDPGSIPGTLGCAEQVLQEYFALPRPPWTS
ncbi:hypothetical protein GCM10010206_17870 [Streptomyces cinerochromogenes]|nr:hypothetical protein GCM10010206_17870 [Streptomyces cinerochromogenes]